MRWLTLESKMLSAVAYDGSKQLLYLRFRNTGDVYRYFHFPADSEGWRSAFRTDVDHDSEVMPISIPN